MFHESVKTHEDDLGASALNKRMISPGGLNLKRLISRCL